MRNILIAMALSAGLTVPLTTRGAARVSKIASLEHSLMPLKMHFNLHADQPRVVALLSPS